MATALPTPIPQRKNTRGYSQVQNSLIENMALLTHAELLLLLAVSRRGDGCQISDSNWTLWTGLKPRQKDYAIQGLSAKGLRINGRGISARFSISWQEWHSYVLKATPPEVVKPRTKGRAVAAPAGARMHEECAANGCKFLCEEQNCERPEGQPFVQPVAQTPQRVVRIDTQKSPSNVQPVAQTAQQLPPEPSEPFVEDSPCDVQPVAQTEKYPRAFEAMRERFPTTGEEFFSSVLEKVRSLALTMPDDETLAGLIPAATKRTQYSEGLYLDTIPKVVLDWARKQAQHAPGPTREDVLRDLKALALKDSEAKPLARTAIQAIEKTDWPVLAPSERTRSMRRIGRPLVAMAVKRMKGKKDWPQEWQDIVSAVTFSVKSAGESALSPEALDQQCTELVEAMAANEMGIAALLAMM